jgi:hypothetical protein
MSAIEMGVKQFLVVGAALGTVALGLEIVVFAPRADRPRETLTDSKPPVAIAGPDAVKAGPVPDRTNERVARILARPLFSPTRRPDTAPVVQTIARADLPRLAGIVSWPGGNYAIFEAEKAGHAVVVGEGAALARWAVQSITPDGVTVSRGDELVVLHPTFGNAPAGTTAD